LRVLKTINPRSYGNTFTILDHCNLHGCAFVHRRSAGLSRKARRRWELKRLSTEGKFWEQEQKD